MNLDDLKKLSEIFNNFAQPIATVIASWVGAKLAKSITPVSYTHLDVYKRQI